MDELRATTCELHSLVAAATDQCAAIGQALAKQQRRPQPPAKGEQLQDPLMVTVSAASPISPGQTLVLREFILSALTTFMAAPAIEFSTARQFRGPLTAGKWFTWFEWIGWLSDEYLSPPE